MTINCLPRAARRRGAVSLLIGVLSVAMTPGCAEQSVGGTGGANGTTEASAVGTSSGASTATSSSTTSTGGGEGGRGGQATTVTTGGGASGQGGATSSASSTTSSGSTAASGTAGGGGAGGGTTAVSGAGGGVGAGGAPFIPPTGSASYPAEQEQNNLRDSANVLQMGTLGFTGSLWPLGDIDVFEAHVTAAGSQIQASVTDGMGGCPPGVTTYLRIFDKDGALLASDKTSGPGGCSQLLPSTKPALQGLAVGSYYVQVEDLGVDAVPFYVVDIEVTAPVCGDHLVQHGAGEQCDDGANVAGDGCSPTCQLEAAYGAEAEPNDTPATANSVGAHVGMLGAIGPVNDVDDYSFDVSVAGSSVTLTVDDGLGACPTGFDSKLSLYDASNAVLASDDDSGPGTCSAIRPTVIPAAANLAVGTYFVKVQASGSSTTTPFYALGVHVQPPACGDSLVEPGEQCDDGNLVAGDGCSPACLLEGTFLPEAEPNDTQATANPLGAADGFITALNPVGDQDYFSFNVVTPGSSVFAQVSDGLHGCPTGFDSKLTLFGPANGLLAAVDDGGTAKCSLLSPATTLAATNLATGTYRVRVESTGNTASVPSYVVTIKVVPPGCGDGVVQAPAEQCDDGNSTSNDGCDATCHAEPPFEIEPNGTLVTATPVWPGTTHWQGAIVPKGDHDYYTFTLGAPGTVTLSTHAVNNAAGCPDDTYLHLDDSTATELLSNDDGGVAPCSSLSTTLQAGTYYVWVQRYQDAQAIPAYQLDLTIQ